MSQLVLDDQLDLEEVLPGLESWITSVRLQSLRPGEKILDDRVPELLLKLKQPTFVTIDHGFWNRSFCHPGYSSICPGYDGARTPAGSPAAIIQPPGVSDLGDPDG